MTTEARPRTKPGSRADLIVRIVAKAAEAHGRGLTTGEIRTAFEKHTKSPAPRSLTSEVHSLTKRGVLEITGGRAGRSLYAPTGAGYAGREDEDDDALLVHRAVRSGFKRLRRPLSTREVAAELKRLGLSLESQSPNAVKKYLETLSRGRIRGARGFRAPRVRRVGSEAISGAPAAFWVPARSETSGGIAPRSAADAVRAAVGHATSELGRPVSVTELRWWMHTAQAWPVHVGVLDRTTLGRVLADTASADRRYENHPRRLHLCPTWWTSYGGQPQRYCLGPPSEEQVIACEFTDMLEVLRPADELESIAGLRRRAEGIGSKPLMAVAQMREELLNGLFADWDGVNKADVFTHAVRAFAYLRRWTAYFGRI